MTFLLLLACTNSVTVSLGVDDDDGGEASDHGDNSGVDDSGAPLGDDGGDGGDGGIDEDSGTGGDGGSDGGSEDEDDDPTRIFQLDEVLQIDLDITEADYDALQRDPYTYVHAQVQVEGADWSASFDDVGLKLKGRLGSLRYPPNKSAFKLDFLEFGSTDKLEGLEKLNLNNMVQDCTFVHELAAYEAHRLVGTPAPRVGYARVRLNGSDYGLYSLIEQYDDEFLQDRFEDDSGNLYDGDYHLWDASNYTLIDFNRSTQDLFELDEGTDVGLADIYAVTTAREAGGDFVANVGPLVDLEQHAAFLAVNAWTGHYDSYSYYSNNYRVYFDPGRDGRAIFLPWDPDWAFYTSTPVGSFYGSLSGACWANNQCKTWAREVADRLSAEIPDGPIQATVEQALDLIQADVISDPKREKQMGEIRGCQADLIDWFHRRDSELAASGW